MLHKIEAMLVVEMQGDFAIGFSNEVVALLAQTLTDRFVTIELAINNQFKITACVADRLCAIVEANDTEPHMAQRSAAVRREPV